MEPEGDSAIRVSGKSPCLASSAFRLARPSTPWPSTVSASSTNIRLISPVGMPTPASGQRLKSRSISIGSPLMPQGRPPLKRADLWERLVPNRTGKIIQPRHST
jgi:hypothetical protein